MNKKKQIQEWTVRVSAIVKSWRALDKACTAAMDAGALDINGPLFNAIWQSFESMVDLVDFDGWLNWFIYENACGKNAFSASGDDTEPKPIRTPAQLARLIVSAKTYNATKQ